MRSPLVAFAVLALSAASLATVACGESPPAKAAQAEHAPGDAAPPGSTAVVPKTTSLHRSGVKQGIARGLGYFLQNVSVDDYPVMKGNKFYGFKIKGVNPELGVDLQPGDIVMRVNGMPIEHPEEADAAMRSLEKARSLRVDLERSGKPMTLELPITED